jgi:hypothetical protein
MKKIAFAAVAIVIVLFVSAILLSRREKKPPPRDIAADNEMLRKFPPREMSTGARRLNELAAALGLDLAKESNAAVGEWRRYVDAELERVEDRVFPPPTEIAEFFRNHTVALDAVRTHLLTRDPIVWPTRVDLLTRAPLPNLVDHSLLTRMFIAHALVHHRWDDLEAAWELQRNLWQRPELISRYVALAQMRNINAAARKLSPPAPRWFAELRDFDIRNAMLEGQLTELWSMQRAAEDTTKGSDAPNFERAMDSLLEPYDVAVAANMAHVMGEAARGIARSNDCDLDARGVEQKVAFEMEWWYPKSRVTLPNLGNIWRRVGRLRAERELTQKILELKSGATPSESSQCSDGKWIVTPGHIRFSKKLENSIPLEY